MFYPGRGRRRKTDKQTDRQKREEAGFAATSQGAFLRRQESFGVWWWSIQVAAASSKLIAMGM